MLTVNTVQSSTPTGAGKVTAKGLNRQRTVRVDHALSVEANHAAAVGALLAAVVTDREKAKILHPSGGQRVRVASTSDAGGKYRWTIDV
jgi:hypothetical protein